MRKLLSIVALGLALVPRAQADNGLFYVGAGVSRDNLRDIAAINGSLNSTNWKVWAGWRLRPSVAGFEADYLKLGSEATGMFGGGTTTSLDYKAFAAYLVGFVPTPVPSLDVFVKAGLTRWTLHQVLFRGNQSVSDNAVQFAWGLGGQVHLGKLGARLEFENFKIPNTNGANIVSLSVFLNLF